MSFQCIRCHAEIDRIFKACPHCGEPVTDFLRRYLEEPVDGKYRIVERLGAGGMGEVYKVEHVFLRSTRVIKVIRPQISGSEDAHERFLREAQLATRVQHPNVATLHDFSALPDGSHYMVWEFIEGENLAQVIHRRGVLPPGEAIGLAVQALAGLEAIHRAGIIHRDISPENLMITRDGLVKIIDLGVAKSDEGDYAVTRTGIFVGKLRYASPEHLGFLAEGEKIDGRADLYSMAVVLVEMLTGKPPFEATTPHQYILHHSRDTSVQSLDLSALPGGSELQGVLRQALEHDRSKRFGSAREFAAALDRLAGTLTTISDDQTLRLTPPSGTTIRTEVPQAPATQTATIRTEVPQAPAAPTVVEPQQRRSSTIVVVVIVLLIAVAAMIAVAVVAWRMWPRPAAVVTSTIAATAPKPMPAQPATTTVEVVPPPPVPQPEPETPVTATVAPAPKKTPARAETERESQPQPAPREPERSVASSEPTQIYTEGGVGSRNEEAISFARERLRGVKRVSLDARGDADLGKQLADRLQGINLTVADHADVQIRFYGKVTHLSFGRKQRAAEATVLKNGQPVFRYELKQEDYRVGDNPAEAFARVLSDVFQ